MKKKNTSRLAILVVLLLCAIILYALIYSAPSDEETTVMRGTGRHSGEVIRFVTVVIDPGHGGEDLGTSSGGLNEKDVNLDVSLKIRDMLVKNGINVKLTRDNDTFIELKDRADFANDISAHLFISVHTNSLPQYPSFSGTETLYAPQQPIINGVDSKRFAGIIQDNLVKKLNTNNHGIKSRPELAVLHHTKMPAVIAELGYITNAAERQNLGKPEFRQKAADALAKATLDTLDKMGAYKNGDNKWVIPSNDRIKK